MYLTSLTATPLDQVDPPPLDLDACGSGGPDPDQLQHRTIAAIHMTHTYSEIRSLVLEIILGKTRRPSQFAGLQEMVQDAIKQRERLPHYRFASVEDNIFREVFWDLFREGIITLGYDGPNREFPWFKLKEEGRFLTDCEGLHFFHDSNTHEALLKNEVGAIDTLTLLYLKEAMNSFTAGCMLAATVMLGVATEHCFLLMMESLQNNDVLKGKFNKCLSEKNISRKLSSFNTAVQAHKSDFPPHVQESLDIQTISLVNIIRTYRNESGHPSGKIISKQQCYILFQVFIPCCKKIHDIVSFATAARNMPGNDC